MEQTYALFLLLFLWGHVELTLTQQVCSQQLPTVENAYVLEEYKKSQYQKGDVIYFSCNRGYTTGFNTTYICTEGGWTYLSVGPCLRDDGSSSLPLGCTPPTVEHGYVWQNKFHFYVHGQTALFQCEPSYQMKGTGIKTCTNGQWTGDLQCQDAHAVSQDLMAKLRELQQQMERLQNQASCQFLLNPNTVNSHLRLSDDLRSVTRVEQSQSYSRHQDRFIHWPQVLSSSGLRGRCYWEVDWTVKGGGYVAVAVSSRRICRGGLWGCVFGHQDYSWRLDIYSAGNCAVRHNDIKTELTARVGSSGRVGVSLDQEGGALSFYDVTNGGRSLLYTFNTTFSEELLPGFGAWGTGSSLTVV